MSTYAERTHYEHEPARNPELIINCKLPFNAEPKPYELVKDFLTPSHIFFVRNHGAVPVIEKTSHKVIVSGLVRKPFTFDVDFLKKNYKEHHVVATLQCAGNRRTELAKVSSVDGVGWGPAALSNAKWTGVLLADVLRTAAIMDPEEGALHVEFEGLDKMEFMHSIDPEDELRVHAERPRLAGFGASIPVDKALNPAGDVLLAYKMNDEELTPDHGYPLRIIVPGFIGARSVKWVWRINVQSRESVNFFMSKDYRVFPNYVKLKDADWEKVTSIQECSVQCVICSPCVLGDGKLDLLPGTYTLFGYACSGGGRKILRVEVSVDGGKTWLDTRITQEEKKPYGRHWSWSFWEKAVTITPPCRIVARAWDSANNTMPEDIKGIWNFRGLMNNSWFTLDVGLLEQKPKL